jgi:sulfur relay (sulfurtransferase) complex TusBCD TusD component (DsrE family)
MWWVPKAALYFLGKKVKTVPSKMIALEVDRGDLLMFMLYVASSESRETGETIKSLVEASLERGHRVVVFFNDESVRLVRAGGDPSLIGFSSRGARLVVCQTSAALSGLSSQGAFPEGVEVSTLGALVEFMDDADRVLFVRGEGVW